MPRWLLSLPAAALLLTGLTAAPAGAAAGACTAGEVTVVVDPAELGGAARTVCVPGGGTATELFHRAGFSTEESHAPGLESFICRVGGKPAKGPCTRGDAYWSLWWSPPGDRADWSYATLGANQLDLEAGAYLAFVWHQGQGAATPPEQSADDSAAAVERPDQAAVESASRAETSDAGEGGSFPWLPLLGGAVVLGAAALVPIRRARS